MRCGRLRRRAVVRARCRRLPTTNTVRSAVRMCGRAIYFSDTQYVLLIVAVFRNTPLTFPKTNILRLYSAMRRFKAEPAIF